jgi:glycosyltransferase involved in cell wall biosynthesis
MKILFLFPYPLKEAPSQRFRFEQYLYLLGQSGLQISCQSFWDEQTWAVLYKPDQMLQKTIGFAKGVARRFTQLFRLSKIDFVFIHRECLPIGPPLIEWIIAKILKKKIIYDFDDAIWLRNTSEENKLAAILKWHSKVAAICQWSYKVSCGNPFLMEYAKQFNRNVIVNPTTIDTVNLHNPFLFNIQKKSTPVVVGWTGTHSTLPYIKPLVQVLEKLEEKFPGQLRFLIIANEDPELKLKFVDFKPWSKQTEVEDLLQMDIGTMPLSNDIWAKGKCGFKALQYLALEIPTVASPVGVNTAIIDQGVNGFLASTHGEWFACLEQLILDKDLRKKMGSKGREKVNDSYSVTSNSSSFLSLFELDTTSNRAVSKKGSKGIL